MKLLIREIEANYEAFATSWPQESARVFASLQANDARFLEGYKRLISLQAWRGELLETKLSPKALGFFLESQNDGLVSLVMARLGSCRAALQSLRSCLENTLFASYYMDHPIELQLWESGKHRLAFRELSTYFQTHPALAGVPPAIHGLPSMDQEYSALSRAVHGSAISFRMSGSEIGTQIWTDDVARMGMYQTRQKDTLSSINHLLLCLFRDELQGAAKPNLRKAVSLAIPASKHASIKEALGVTLFRA